MFCRWALPLSCVAFLSFSAGYGQPQPPDEPPRVRALMKPETPAADPPPPSAKPATAQSVDDLITRLEKLRQQKAELEKQEKEVVEQLREIVRSQADRLSKLGINLGPPDPKEVGKGTYVIPPDPKEVGNHTGGSTSAPKK
ncbi:MAG TPA: hypothetical protein VKD71_12590 [Gemmataceae bacterium]|nr:hypothetical protein [Gemmataceae bacterium]